MKRRYLTFLLVLAVLLMTFVPVMARSLEYTPVLIFDGTTAKCSMSVSGNSKTDEISVMLKLWCGSTCLATWEKSGCFYLSMSVTETVTKGYTYRLTADVTINGKAQPQTETSAYCP